MLLLFLSSFLAATFIPFSSELHFIAVLEQNNLWEAVTVATLGNTLGGVFTFYLGWLAKWNWIEKYLRVKPEKVEKFKDRITKYGASLAFLTWLPFIGDIIAIALGFFRVSPAKVVVLMTIGKGLRYLVFGLFFVA